MSLLIKSSPKRSDGLTLRRMGQGRRQIGQWTQHEGAPQQIRTGQDRPLKLTDHVAKQQQVKVHSPWRPFGRRSSPATAGLDPVQQCQQLFQRQGR